MVCIVQIRTHEEEEEEGYHICNILFNCISLLPFQVNIMYFIIANNKYYDKLSFLVHPHFHMLRVDNQVITFE